MALLSIINPQNQTLLARIPSFNHLKEELQCGKPGFTVVTVNNVALAVFAVNLALGGALIGTISLAITAAVLLPSITLFGPLNYFYYLPQPLLMGLGFAIAWSSVKVNPNGAWNGLLSNLAHFNDYRLLKGLESFFQSHGVVSIMDCGCGNGFYVNKLQKNGSLDVNGCDGNPDTPARAGSRCIVADLSKQKFLSQTKHTDKKFDCVMSFEVAEHLPKDYEETFLNNLVETVKEDGWIILSWAKEGQGGLGHINEQNCDYVLQKMQSKGWGCDFEETEKLRINTSPNTFWFRDSLYVFRHLA